MQRDVLFTERLHDDIAYNTPVIGVHARPISIEDTRDPNVELVLAVVAKEQPFGATLAFIVATA